MNIGIFYGTAGGNTKIVADALAEAFDLDEDNNINIEEDYDDTDQLLEYDVLFLGTSTWGQGDVFHGWVDILFEIESEDVDFSGKTVAFFGAGDYVKHGEHFCSALGKMYDLFTSKGAKGIGFMPTDGYTYEASLAVKDDQFCGLPIDQMNEADKTPARIEQWIGILKNELGV